MENFNMFKNSILLIILFILKLQNCNAEIIEVNKFFELKNIIIDKSDIQTLVLFDIDDVLITPKDEFNFRSKVRKDIKKGLSISKI